MEALDRNFVQVSLKSCGGGLETFHYLQGCFVDLWQCFQRFACFRRGAIYYLG